MKEPRTALEAIMRRHQLTQAEVAASVRIAQSAIGAIASGARQPRADTCARIIAFCRRYEPGITFEKLFAPELLTGRGRVA